MLQGEGYEGGLLSNAIALASCFLMLKVMYIELCQLPG
jgi:hypothetical protein